MKKIFISVIITLSAISTAFASPTKYWNLYKYTNFSGGTSKGVYLPSNGGLIPGLRSIEVKAGKKTSFPGLFTSIVKSGGKYYISSGAPAQIWTLKNGKLNKLSELKGELMISTMIKVPGGFLAATIGNGKIYKVKTNGSAKLLLKLPAEHVWSLVLKGNTVYAGTGPKAEIYKFSSNGGKAVKVWSCKEKHILSLAVYKKGLLIGTSPEARLYHLPFGKKKAGLIHDFYGNEIRNIIVDGNTIYASVNNLSYRPSVPNATTSYKRKSRYGKRSSKAFITANGQKSIPRRQVVRGSGNLWKIESDGTTENLFGLSRGYFTFISKHNNKLYASDGASGRIFSFNLDKYAASMMVQVKERQILTFLFEKNGTGIAATGDGAKIYSLVAGKGKNKQIRYISPVLDASRTAEFGNFFINKTKGNIKIETRSGVTPKSKDDELWNPWKTVSSFKKLPDGQEYAKIKSRSARYFQYRITWSPGSKTEVKSIKIFFVPSNLTPRINSISAYPKTFKKSYGNAPVTDMILKQKMRPRSGKIKISWSVYNPDRDQLIYKVWVRKLGYKKWFRLSPNSDITSPYFTWKAINFPDGVYLIKVIASDAPSNTPSKAKTFTKISHPIIVDNHAPVLTALKINKNKVSFGAKDSFSRLIAAGYRTDGGKWLTIMPKDGIFDSLKEKFSFTMNTSSLSKGIHLLEIRVMDETGNLLTISQEFTK